MARPRTITDERQRRRAITVSLSGYQAEQLAARGGSAYLQALLDAPAFPSVDLRVRSINRQTGSVTLECAHSGTTYGPNRVGEQFRVELFLAWGEGSTTTPEHRAEEEDKNRRARNMIGAMTIAQKPRRKA